MTKTGSIGVIALAAASLAGCAVVPPSAPSLASLPGAGKTYEQFQLDDLSCRGAAGQATGGPGPSQAATNNAVGSAVVGTAIGAAAGALIGSASGNVGAGAAIGAGAGLLTGSAVGANGAQYSAYGLQRQYDITYAQCMSAKGNQVPPPAAIAPDYPPYGYYGPGYGPGAVIVTPGFEFGPGYYRRPYYYRRY